MNVLAVDFDGVLRRWPSFIGWFTDLLEPRDILIRSRLFFLRRLLINICINHTPMIVNGKLITTIRLHKPKKLILVSARYKAKQKTQALNALKPYLNFDKVYFREDPDELEWKYKERILKGENVDIFIEDRRIVVDYLRKKGINAIHIKDAEKYLDGHGYRSIHPVEEGSYG